MTKYLITFLLLFSSVACSKQPQGSMLEKLELGISHYEVSSLLGPEVSQDSTFIMSDPNERYLLTFRYYPVPIENVAGVLVIAYGFSSDNERTEARSIEWVADDYSKWIYFPPSFKPQEFHSTNVARSNLRQKLTSSSGQWKSWRLEQCAKDGSLRLSKSKWAIEPVCQRDEYSGHLDSTYDFETTRLGTNFEDINKAFSLRADTLEWSTSRMPGIANYELEAPLFGITWPALATFAGDSLIMFMWKIGEFKPYAYEPLKRLMSDKYGTPKEVKNTHMTASRWKSGDQTFILSSGRGDEVLLTRAYIDQ